MSTFIAPHRLDRRLTIDDMRLDGAAIMRDARNFHAASPWVPFAEHFAAVLRGAVFERETIIHLRARNEAYRLAHGVLEAEASALADAHDLQTLMDARDGWFFGMSTTRERRLPVYERAVAIKLARAGRAAPITHRAA